MQPTDVRVIGQELAIRWDTGVETYVRLELLRRACPCAGCQGERDILGNLYQSPARLLGPAAFELRQIQTVGGYALQPVWGDGHATGLYAYAYLQRVADPSQQGYAGRDEPAASETGPDRQPREIGGGACGCQHHEPGA
jgi:DUF971 family protein